MNNQPRWQCIANLGDANPYEHGGLFVFVDTTGVYSAEVEKWEPEYHCFYRVIIDQLVLHEGLLIPASIYKLYLKGADLPKPIEEYEEWFSDKTENYAASVGMDWNEYRQMFCNSDPVVRARAYEIMFEHEGWVNWDSTPLKLSKQQTPLRIGRHMRQLEAKNAERSAKNVEPKTTEAAT